MLKKKKRKTQQKVPRHDMLHLIWTREIELTLSLRLTSKVMETWYEAVELN